ncbi:hypothetical protein HF325_003387 [Metschnikowia pulcherrima]|uniref:Uncharacterized protein n=1 Tax=Metschnikowia pulcherrima TaxID=27326 RepID=A0A8H7GTR6_9ASCO|nr:hypothetical protein HF325_003387 [Metschnikowia pulcherrima]
MKKLFGRKSGSSSETRERFHRRSNSHSYSGPSRTGEDLNEPINHLAGSRLTSTRSVPESDTNSLHSAPFSEAETLTVNKEQCFHLQSTYQDNFTSYIPFLVRRQRATLARAEAAENAPVNDTLESDAGTRLHWGADVDSDDDKTMVSQRESLTVMHRATTSYNHKRTLLIASELIRNNLYVFPSPESFELFKELRANSKKLRKNSIVLYDEDSNVRRIFSRRRSLGNISPKSHNAKFPLASDLNEATAPTTAYDLMDPVTGVTNGRRATFHDSSRRNSVTVESPSHVTSQNRQNSSVPNLNNNLAHHKTGENNGHPFSKDRFSNCTIDSRPHLVPLDYKVKGKGLPLFKIVVPYMSTFRRKTPYMIFRRYLEKPKPPIESEAIDDEQFETYDFCTVHLKNSQHYKRYKFMFRPANAPEFTIFAFQNNYRPFADFNYKETRFRVFGTSITMAYLTHYNPELKLHVLDGDQPSLMDNLIEKNAENSMFKGRGDVNDAHLRVQSEEVGMPELENPVPNPSNPIIRSNIDGTGISNRHSIPNEMPPFGRFLDACEYMKSSPIIPKKYSEVGKIDVYQNPREMSTSDYLSSLSVDLDSLVLSTIILALRETSIRTTVKHPGTSHTSRMSLLTSIALNGGTSANLMAVA